MIQIRGEGVQRLGRVALTGGNLTGKGLWTVGLGELAMSRVQMNSLLPKGRGKQIVSTCLLQKKLPKRVKL